ncbi:MAG: DNA-binding response regulator [Firmicutes bacterium HGW-Firmicutes-8]|nr:MAG: DNA-binding response regulator [Firmicutes bacterium HGW-Firmicutes-8]
MLKIIIAEDDPAMRIVLKKALNDIPGLEVVGEVENGKQLVQLVEKINPDVVFVDIDMPEMNGVDAAREIFDINPKIFIVFATAYDSYTHEAFEVYAFDYLVKPFNLERIRQTMERIKELKLDSEKTGFLAQPISQSKKENIKLKIQSNDRCYFVNVQDIIFITRIERKTVIYTKHDVIKTYEPLQQLAERLKNCNFFRCHKGYIINTDMVTEILPWGHKTYIAKLENTKETALMTLEKAKEFRTRYCVGQ